VTAGNGCLDMMTLDVALRAGTLADRGADDPDQRCFYRSITAKLVALYVHNEPGTCLHALAGTVTDQDMPLTLV